MITSNVPFKKLKFPAGELHIQLHDVVGVTKAQVAWEFKDSEDVIELLLYCNALDEAGYELELLEIPYFPFSRQDRVANYGDSFSLKVMCNLINGLNAKRVVVWDPHSDVLPALLKNCSVIAQETIFAPMIRGLREPVTLISPDGGALKKIYKLAKLLPGTEVVECAKKRDTVTGEITGTVVYAEPGSLDHKTCVIVDDICDGGRTFIEIAKAIRRFHVPRTIILMVTHGIFSQGLKVFENHIDELYTRNGRHVASNLLQDVMIRRAV